MVINHICFIVESYPTQNEPTFTFARELICSIADLDVKCSVIARQSITKSIFRKRALRPFFWQDTTRKNNKIDVYQPYYLSFSNIKICGISLSSMLSQRVIVNTFNKININPDVLYAHFWHNGVTAGIIGTKHRTPFFVATGESEIGINDVYGEKRINKYLKDVSGVICVSSKNMRESLDLELAPREKMIIIPNAIDSNKFYPINKTEARKMLGYKENDFIIIFVGAFIERKGALRVEKAIENVSDVKAIYIGNGVQRPEGQNILFCGRLPHSEIVYYLNAADVFVLPTLAEGCCNAIIEAMACGLPIISSDRPFNDDILNDENSIKINPENTGEIKDAIIRLRDNSELRESMSRASLRIAEKLDIKQRAVNILEFMKNRVDY